MRSKAAHSVVPAAYVQGEKRTRIVVLVIASLMIAEILGGQLFGSMALEAQGWHMGTHTLGISVALVAYLLARRGGFAVERTNAIGGLISASLLLLVACHLGVESIARFINPVPIQFNEGVLVAGLALMVNLGCAFLLKSDQSDASAHDHAFRAARLHVLSNALLSGLTLTALSLGTAYGWAWMDPMMGLIGTIVIARWSFRLLRDARATLAQPAPAGNAIA